MRLNNKISGLLGIVILANCAHHNLIKHDQYPNPCDTLITKSYKQARPFIKDDVYNLGDTIIYRINGKCVQVVKDSMILSDSTYFRGWK